VDHHPTGGNDAKNIRTGERKAIRLTGHTGALGIEEEITGIN